MRRYTCIPRGPVTTGQYSLITVQDDHIEQIRRWRNAQMNILRQSEPITNEQQSTYFKKHIWPTLLDQRPQNLLLVLLESGRPVGYGGLVHIAWEHLRGEVSFLLNPELAQVKSKYEKYFTAYLGLIKQLSFEELGFRRLFTETYSMRIEHIKILETQGFMLEGRLRNHVVIDNSPVDSLIHGVLSNER